MWLYVFFICRGTNFYCTINPLIWCQRLISSFRRKRLDFRDFKTSKVLKESITFNVKTEMSSDSSLLKDLRLFNIFSLHINRFSSTDFSWIRLLNKNHRGRMISNNIIYLDKIYTFISWRFVLPLLEVLIFQINSKWQDVDSKYVSIEAMKVRFSSEVPSVILITLR